jgi:hypothetical protein
MDLAPLQQWRGRWKFFQEQFEGDEHEQRAGERHRQTQRQGDGTKIPCGGDVRRVDIAEVDAKKHDQHDFGDEHQTEEKRQSAHGVVAALLKGVVIKLIK